MTLSSRTCAPYDRARLSCLHSWGSSVSSLPSSCFPRSSFLSSRPSFLFSLLTHAAHTGSCLLRARTVQVLMLCAHCSLLTLSPAQLSDMLSVTPCPYSCGQQAKRFLDSEHQASAGRVPPVIGDPASKATALLRAGSSAELGSEQPLLNRGLCSDPHCSRPTARLLGSSAQRADPTQARLLGLHRKKSNRCEAREEAGGGGD